IGDVYLEEEIFDLPNEYSLENFKAIQETVFQKGGRFRHRKWTGSGTKTSGEKVILSETSKSPDAEYGDPNNKWSLKEWFSPEELPEGYTTDDTKIEMTSGGYDVRRYVDAGIWD